MPRINSDEPWLRPIDPMLDSDLPEQIALELGRRTRSTSARHSGSSSTASLPTKPAWQTEFGPRPGAI